MTTATQVKCACERCHCMVTPGAGAIEKDGKYYCTEACAEGHPSGRGCGHPGCEC
jgi:hypothetical protein